MLPATRWRSQPATGSRTDAAARLPFSHPLPPAEWRILCTARPNLLIDGTRSAVEATLLAMMPHLLLPVGSWRAGDALQLHAVVQGTLVLHDVSGLDETEQRSLLRWIDGCRDRVQVIATTSRPLFALVEGGTFLEDLYYRLNVVCVHPGSD